MIKNILCVCTGNICRSPMLEGYLKHHLGVKNSSVQVSSAGISALVDRPAVIEAQQIMSNHGIDISSHRARQITQDIALKAELILAMEDEHKHFVEKNFPNVRGRVFLLGKWHNNLEVFDPYRQPLKSFEYTFDLIEKTCQEWIKRLF
jgi:protein-tyrosine phosphatase